MAEGDARAGESGSGGPRACGAWPSPLSAAALAGHQRALSEPRVDGGRCYWLEGRPAEGGRQVLMTRRGAEDARELTPAPHSVRTRLYEYGGGAYTTSEGTVYFVDVDGGLYRRASVEEDPRAAPELLVRLEGVRFGEPVVDRRRGRLYVVSEDHRRPEDANETWEPVHAIVAIDLRAPTAEPTCVAAGSDFYASLALRPDGRELAWLSWQHPDMPWDRSELWVVDLETGEQRCVASGEEALFQPQWASDGTLYVSTDRRGGWWNVHRWVRTDARSLGGGALECVAPIDAEVGLPRWVGAMSVYALLAADQALCALSRDGRWELARVDLGRGLVELLETPFSHVTSLHGSGGEVVFIASSPRTLPAVWRYDARTGALETVASSGERSLCDEDLSVAEPFDYRTADDSIVHAFFYAPMLAGFRPLAGERPPLLVLSHGGPTAATSDAYNPQVQFWTTRGFAVLDVNYRGSTGYGRSYRRALEGRWGVADVEDCVWGARALVEAGKVDGERLIIRGSSAGGYTTLCALTFHSVFRAGASRYGIGDLEALARETHKFESHYHERLVGPYPAARELYRERSPIHHVERLSCPVIFLHGLEDRVVPPAQAEAMVHALEAKGIAVELVRFSDEGHGFRKAANIERAYEAELAFFARVFGFTPAAASGPPTP